MEIKVYSRLIVSGPIKIPIGPKRETPPSTAKRISRGDIFVFLPIIIGERKLSIIPTITDDQIASPTAPEVDPVASRNNTAGTETRAVPIVGMSEVIAATTPQTAGFGIPKIQSPKPKRTP